MHNNIHKPNEEIAVIREYADIAPQYDMRWAAYITATLRETLKRLDIKPTDRLLDIGCGTGSLLHAISQKQLVMGHDDNKGANPPCLLIGYVYSDRGRKYTVITAGRIHYLQ